MGSGQSLLICLLDWNMVSRHNYLFCVVQNTLTNKNVANDKVLGGDPIVLPFLFIYTGIIFSYLVPHIPRSGSVDAQNARMQHSAPNGAPSLLASKSEDTPWTFLQQNQPRLLLLAKKPKPTAILRC